MNKLVILAILGATTTTAYAQDASGPFTLNVRGGIVMSLADYPYALSSADDVVVDSVATSDFGFGDYLAATIAKDDLFGNVGGEFTISYLRVTGAADVGDIPGTANCAPNIYDVISLSHNQCMDGAATQNTTTLLQARALATYDYPNSGVQVVGGLGYLDFDSNSNGMMYYPGESSVQNRTSSFSGFGLVLGLRQDFEVFKRSTLNIEGLVGVFSGDQGLNITDDYDGTPGAFSKSRNTEVYTLEVTASLSSPAKWLNPNAEFEWGLTYVHVFNVMDTTNYNSTVTGTFGSSGSTKGDFDAVSLFFGLTMPL